MDVYYPIQKKTKNMEKKIIRKKSEWEGERKRSFISSPTTLGSAALQLATSNWTQTFLVL